MGSPKFISQTAASSLVWMPRAKEEMRDMLVAGERAGVPTGGQDRH
jgi:hypothetical protein